MNLGRLLPPLSERAEDIYRIVSDHLGVPLTEVGRPLCVLALRVWAWVAP